MENPSFVYPFHGAKALGSSPALRQLPADGCLKVPPTELGCPLRDPQTAENPPNPTPIRRCAPYMCQRIYSTRTHVNKRRRTHTHTHTHDGRDKQGTGQGGLNALDHVRCSVNKGSQKNSP